MSCGGVAVSEYASLIWLASNIVMVVAFIVPVGVIVLLLWRRKK